MFKLLNHLTWSGEVALVTNVLKQRTIQRKILYEYFLKRHLFLLAAYKRIIGFQMIMFIKISDTFVFLQPKRIELPQEPVFQRNRTRRNHLILDRYFQTMTKMPQRLTNSKSWAMKPTKNCNNWPMLIITRSTALRLPPLARVGHRRRCQGKTYRRCQ